jgi:hypothetical protein
LYILHLLPTLKALHTKIRWITKQANHAVQSKQFWVKHPAAINVTVQAYQCRQKRGTPIGKNKTKMERNYTHRERSETFNNNSHGDDQPSYMNEHRKTNENRVTQPNAGHPKACERRRGLKKRRINRIQKKRSLKRKEARKKKNRANMVFRRLEQIE